MAPSCAALLALLRNKSLSEGRSRNRLGRGWDLWFGPGPGRLHPKCIGHPDQIGY